MSDPISPDPAPANSPEPAVVQPSDSGAGTELQPNIAATLACFLSILGGLVFLVLEKKNKFVRFYAMQSLIFGAVSFALLFVIAIVAFVLGKMPLVGGLFALIFWPIYVLVVLGFFAVSIITMANAFKNKEWEIPYIGRIARKQLVSGPLSKL